MDSRVTPPKRVTLPTCSPPPPCKQVLIQVYIFVPLLYSAPFLRFSHNLLYTNFFIYVYHHAEYYFFLIPDDAADRGKLGIKFLSLISALKSLP